MKDPANVERVLRAYEPALRRLVASYERDAALAEDLLQEILLALVRALPGFRQDCSERTFVYRVAHNRALTHLAARRAPLDEIDRAAHVPDPAPWPEEAAAAGQRREALLTALRSLPLRHRQVLGMALEGLSTAEVAGVLGITENNVGVRLNRARAALRSALTGGKEEP